MLSTGSMFRLALLGLPALLLAACGGGGGGGGDAPSGNAGTTGQLVITAGNSQAVAAEAMDASTNTEGARLGVDFATGVQVDGGSAPANALQLAQAARKLVTMVPAKSSHATGVTTTDTVNCRQGGSITVTENSANGTTLQTGDAVSITANNCSERIDGSTVVLNGNVAITVTRGPYDPDSTTYPKSVALQLVATNFSIAQGGVTSRSNGDLSIDLIQNSASTASLTLNGTSLSNTTTSSAGTHTVTLRSYFHKIDASTSGAMVQMSASVETDNSRFASGTVSYDVSTPTALNVDASGNLTSGSIKVTGRNSALLLTVTSTNTFSLQVDADGNGVYESSSTVTRAQLVALI